MTEIYDLNITSGMDSHGRMIITPDQILTQMGQGWTEHLFFLWMLFLSYVVIERYKNRIFDVKLLNLWNKQANAFATIVCLYYPVTYLIYSPY